MGTVPSSAERIESLTVLDTIEWNLAQLGAAHIQFLTVDE